MSRPNQFLSPEGDLEDYFVDEYWLIDQYVGDVLWVWGSAGNGQHGNGATTGSISTPITTFAGGTNWKQVSVGVAIKTDGTLWTWGWGTSGRLGNGVTTGNRSTPITTFAGGTNWKQVSSSSLSTAAIKTDGTLWIWGSGYNGRLGNGVTTGNRSTPITTFAGGTNWNQVSVGDGHVAAIKTDGTLWTWGDNAWGELGTNDTITRSTPVTTFAGGTNWKQASAGFSHTAAVRTNGTLWVWGLANDGRLGNRIIDNTGNRSVPVTTFAGGNNWKQVSAGYRHTAAIKTDGTLWTWGLGDNGRLGDAQTLLRSTPITTFAGGNNWKQVSAAKGTAGNHTVSIKTNGTLWSWGSISSGQLGNRQGSISVNGFTPVTTFAGGTNWKQATADSDGTIAVFSGTTPDLPIS